jgi:ribonuclease VapC
VIVDSSAVVAILLREPGWEPLVDRLAAAPTAGIGAPTLVETGIVLAARMGIVGKSLLARFVQEAQLSTIPFTDQHWPIAVDAFLRYGKGRHPAALNFGDCLTYAVSSLADQPLLCLGNDFAQTDLSLVLSGPG